jgi:methyl-accepting chemotaxis protein
MFRGIERICVKSQYADKLCSEIPSRGVLYVASTNAAGKSTIAELIASMIIHNPYYRYILDQQKQGSGSGGFVIDNVDEIIERVKSPLFYSPIIRERTVHGYEISKSEIKPVVKLQKNFVVSFSLLATQIEYWYPDEVNVKQTLSQALSYDFLSLLDETIYAFSKSLNKIVSAGEAFFAVKDDVKIQSINVLSDIKEALKLGQDNMASCRDLLLLKEVSVDTKRLSELEEKLSTLTRTLVDIEREENRLRSELASIAAQEDRRLVDEHRNIELRLKALRDSADDMNEKIRSKIASLKELLNDENLKDYVKKKDIDEEKIISEGLSIEEIIDVKEAGDAGNMASTISSIAKNAESSYKVISDLVNTLSKIEVSINNSLSLIESFNNNINKGIDLSPIHSLCEHSNDIEKCREANIIDFVFDKSNIDATIGTSISDFIVNAKKLAGIIKRLKTQFTNGMNTISLIIDGARKHRERYEKISDKLTKISSIANEIEDLRDDIKRNKEEQDKLRIMLQEIEGRLKVRSKVADKRIAEITTKIAELSEEKNKIKNEISNVKSEIDRIKKKMEEAAKRRAITKGCEILEKFYGKVDIVNRKLTNILKDLGGVDEEGFYHIDKLTDASKLMLITARSIAFTAFVNDVLRSYIELREGKGEKIPAVIDAVVLPALDLKRKRIFLKMLRELSEELDQPILILDIADRYISKEIKSDSDIDEIISYSVASVPVQG